MKWCNISSAAVNQPRKHRPRAKRKNGNCDEVVQYFLHQQ